HYHRPSVKIHLHVIYSLVVFFHKYAATTQIYTLSLHDALPISAADQRGQPRADALVDDLRADEVDVAVEAAGGDDLALAGDDLGDRKSTRLNSSHLVISYAVFCLKKKSSTCHREKVPGYACECP